MKRSTTVTRVTRHWHTGAAFALAATLAAGTAGPAGAQCDLRQINFNVIKDGFSGANELNGASGVALSPDGAHVYVAASPEDAITVFARSGSEGDLSLHQVLKRASGTNTATITYGITGLNGVVSLALSPDGAHAYATGTNADSIVVFSRDTNPASGSYGRLTVVSTAVNGSAGVVGLDGPVDVAVSEDGEWLAVASSNSDAVVLFARNTSTGAITYNDSIQHNEGPGTPAVMQNPTAVAIKDNHVYVASAGGTSSDPAGVTVLEINDSGSVGQLITTQAFTNFNLLKNSSDIAVSGNGETVYIAATDADAVAAYSRDAGTGALTFLQTYTHANLSKTSGVTVNPTDSRVYATGRNSDSLFALRRNPTGTLTFIRTLTDMQAIPNSQAQVDGLDGPVKVAVSPDTNQVYVVADVEDSVAWFDAWEPSSVTCSDASSCTENDHCDGTSGTCIGDALDLGTICDDGNICTTDDMCDGEGHCTATACNVDAGCGCENICQVTEAGCICGAP